MATLPRTLLLLAAAITPVLGFCGSRTHLDRREAEEETVPLATFGYIGTGGPLMWHHLSAGQCSMCKRLKPVTHQHDRGVLYTCTRQRTLLSLFPDTISEGTAFENLGSTIEVVMEGLGGHARAQRLELRAPAVPLSPSKRARKQRRQHAQYVASITHSSLPSGLTVV